MNNLDDFLKEAGTVAVAGHIRPDGDCVGSCLAAYNYIKTYYPNVRVDLYLQEIPNIFKFMARSEEILHDTSTDNVYDLFLSLDCGDTGRLGGAAAIFDRAKKTVCVDHHISNQSFADENYIVPDASSTSELVYQLLDKAKISKEVAEALYLGIIHDTGVFQYSCTAPSTMRAAADLMEKGVDTSALIQDTYYEKTYAQNQVLGRALLESILFMDKKCIAVYIKQRDMEFYGVTPKDLDGIVSHLRNTKGVEVAVFMYETKPSEYKVSLRSTRNVDVSVIAQYFGGGGHKKAAGFTMTGQPLDVLNNLSVQIAHQLGEEV